MPRPNPSVDPRLALSTQAEMGEGTVRPIVALTRTGPPAALFWAGIVLAGILLFVILDSRRRSQIEPAAIPAVGIASPPPPPLYIPPSLPPAAVVMMPRATERFALEAQPRPRASTFVGAQPQPQAPIRYSPPQAVPSTGYVPQPPPPPPAPQRVSNSPTVVIDTTAAAPPVQNFGRRGPGNEQSIGEALGRAEPVDRARSSVFANRSTTVAQGALIPAVLETAFDSRRPGFARAIVSRDVRGFDGTHVLIPRGSRLTGEYRSDIQPGQKRALINWTRLVRPDGVTIAIASPSADTLGRGGVRGDYDSHFFERFTGALLQTVIQTGASLATRATAGNVYVALPGAIQNQVPTSEIGKVVPTLKVAAGTSISVFVARDLDFSRAEKAR